MSSFYVIAKINLKQLDFTSKNAKKTWVQYFGAKYL